MPFRVWLITLLLAAPALAQAPAASPKLRFYDIKVQWNGSDGEELPTWISGQFHLDAAGKPVGQVVEVALSDDGNDDDGDPAGFDSWVFSTADGSLTDLTLEQDKVSFSAHDPTDKDWSLHVAAHCTDSAAGPGACKPSPRPRASRRWGRTASR